MLAPTVVMLVAGDARADQVSVMGATLPGSRSGMSAVWDGANVYVFGGLGYLRYDQIVRYNPATDTTTTMNAVLPTGRSALTAVWDGSNAYVFGGYGYDTTCSCDRQMSQIVRYNPSTNAVTTMGATLPIGRAGASAVWDGTNVYVFGGLHGSLGSPGLTDIVRYNPATDTVTTMGAALPTGSHSASAIWDGTSAYIFGGCCESITRQLSNRIVRYTPATDTVTVLPTTLPTARAETSAVWDGANAFIFGGSDGAPTAQILRFDPGTGTVTPASALLPRPRSGTAAAWNGSAAYVVGGFNPTEGTIDEIVRYTTGSPGAPRDVAASAGPDGGQVALAWRPPANPGDSPITGYRVFRGTISGGETLLLTGGCSGLGAVLSCVDSGLVPGQTYYYQVSAVSDQGEGTRSSEVNAVPFTLSESLTGNTPFGGVAFKPTFPGQEARPSVNLANGELIVTFSLLGVPEPLSEDFSFDLTYRSMRNAPGNASLSYRWDANWFQWVELNGTILRLHEGEGRTLVFTNTTTGWDGPPGSYSRVTDVGGKLELRSRDGSRRVYSPDQANRLTDAYDAAGNHWTLSYGGPSGRLETITDPLSRAFTLSYDASVSVATNPFYATNQRPILTGIADFAGRSASLEYDLATGRLIAIRTPGATSGASYITRFTYDANHRLTSVKDPEGVTYVTIGSDALGRTTAQHAATGETHEFQYDYATGVTHAFDGNGNDVEWRFIPTGMTTLRAVPSAKVVHTRGLRATDPPAYTTTYAHNGQDEETSVTYPAGNSVTRTYDENSPSFFARGNLLAVTRSPGPVVASPFQSTSQANITTRYTYDSVCNKPVSIVDPRGSDPAFVPPNNGAASAARYTTTITYGSACKPLTVQGPTVNPAGVPNGAFTSAYAGQAVTDAYTYNAAGQLLTHTDPAGVVTTRTYYAASTAGKPAGYLESETVDPGAGSHLALTTTYEYVDIGVVNKVTDPRGNVRAFTVDPRGRITQEAGPALASGSIHTLRTYDGNDRLASLQRENAPGSGTYATTTFTYDALGRLTSETAYPSSTHAFTAQYAYDGNGNVVRRTGGGGETVNTTYDERNLLISKSGPQGGTYEYDANGNLRAFTDPLGHGTSYEYDGYDRLSVETNAQQSRSVTSYDPAGNVVSERGLGGTSGRILYEHAASYDEGNRPYLWQAWMQSAATMPPSSSASFGPEGRWVVTLTEWDARGLPTRVVNDNGHVSATTYDAAGRRSTITDPSGNVVQNAYDKAGNPLQVKETVAGATLSTCPQVCSTHYAYDAENHRVTTTKSDGATRTDAYDGRGNLVQTTDEAGNVVLYAYDDADRQTTVQRSLGTTPATYVTTTTAWDDENRVTSRCDDATQCTTYAYVYATQLVAKQTPPTGPGITNVYDAKGNVKTVAYSSGKTVEFDYDSLDRLTTIAVAAAVASPGATRQQFTYDDMSRVTEATDNGMANLGSGVVTSLAQVVATQRYDTLGRVIGESQLGLAVTHTLDGVGNVIGTTYPSLDGRVVSRSYDASERLDRVWDAKGLVVDESYQGRFVSEKAFGGPMPSLPATGPTTPVTRTQVDHDAAQRPAIVQHKDGAGASVLAGLTTRFDATGNRLAQKVQGNVAGAGTDKHSQLYALDALYRTTAWKRGSLNAALDAVGSPEQQASWPTIDGRNDWQTWTGTGTGSCTRTTGTSGSPPVRQVVDACTSGTKTYTFDADGNLGSDSAYAYKWDFQNRLVRVDDMTGRLVVAYGYDAFDRRVVKVFPDNVASAPGAQANREGWYTFSGQHVLQESQPVGSVLPTTTPPTAPSVHVIRQWVYGSQIDEVLAMDVDSSQNGTSAIDASDKRYFYAYDSAGNVLGLVSQAGRLVEAYSYQAYGNVTILKPAAGATDVKWDGTDQVSTGTYGSDPTPRPYSPSGNLWFFTGRQYDPEVGLYNYRARHYHPGLSQFMSLDPIGTWGDPANLGNAYVYVGNNPGSRTDPSGLCPWCLPALGIATVLTAGAIIVDTATYGYQVATTDKEWDHAVARERYKNDLATGVTLALLMIGEGAGTNPAASTARSTVAKTAEAEAHAARQAIATSTGRPMPFSTAGGQAIEAAGSEAVGTFSAGHRRTGQTVIGTHPTYIQEGESLGARYFNVPEQHWDALGPAGQWKANQKFLDRTIARGDEVILSNLPPEGRPSSFRHEVTYLQQHGYKVADPLRMVLQ